MKNRDISQLLANKNIHMEKLHRIVESTIAAEYLIVKNLLNPPEEQLSVGQKISDKVARFGGSWKFIILFSVLLVLWILFNVLAIKQWRFDPFRLF